MEYASKSKDSNKALAGYQAAGSRPYKENTDTNRGAGPNGIDAGFSPLSVGITKPKGQGKTAPVPEVGYSQAGM